MYAAANVRRQGYGTFMPLVWDERLQAPVPMFPGYLFVSTKTGAYSSLEGTYGVVRVVRPNDKAPASPVPRGLVARMRRMKIKNGKMKGCIALPAQPKPAKKIFKRDQVVEVTKGPFEGKVGLYQGMTRDERLQVLFTLIGRKVIVTLDEGMVDAA
jgi:transcription antitermination factor NusG